MATRTLPGVYTSLNDLSQIPEGPTSLIVGYVLAADKGEVNVPKLVTSPADFLAKYAYLGKPGVFADPTYWDILKVLPQTNQMYVIRAANNPRYGTQVIRQEHVLGEVININSNDENFTVTIDNPDVYVDEGMRLQLEYTDGARPSLDGYYHVKNVENHDGVTLVHCFPHPFFKGFIQYKFNVISITDILPTIT